MNQLLSAPIFSICFLIGSFLMMEVGRRAGIRQLVRDPERALDGLGVIDSALFALFGLLIAFTFSGGAARLDWRKQLIAEEANDVGTAYLRIDLLTPKAQPPLRQLMRDYVEARLSIYRQLPDLEAAGVALAKSEEIQSEIWKQAVAATKEPDTHVDGAKLLLPALNSMFDIATTRTMAARIHPPNIIYGLLFVLGLGCSLLAGYGMAQERYRNWLHIFAFTVIMGISLFVILEIEFPRAGFLRMDTYDDVLVKLLETM